MKKTWKSHIKNVGKHSVEVCTLAPKTYPSNHKLYYNNLLGEWVLKQGVFIGSWISSWLTSSELRLIADKLDEYNKNENPQAP